MDLVLAFPGAVRILELDNEITRPFFSDANLVKSKSHCAGDVTIRNIFVLMQNLVTICLTVSAANLIN